MDWGHCPEYLLKNAWDVTIESYSAARSLRIDAPGWTEHISERNAVRYLSCLQSFKYDAIATTIQTLSCPPHCGKDKEVTELTFTEYPRLQSIRIASFSFPHVKCVKVQRLKQLREFHVADHCFMHPRMMLSASACVIEHCPHLRVITIGSGSFLHYSVFSVKSGPVSRQ